MHAFSAWSRLEENHAAHLQLTLAGGPRLDVFEYPEGVPVAPMHPHIALAVRPGHLLRWMDRLTEHGVIVAGPTRPGPLGQASFYFNDPFGNHLELVTVGFVDSVLSVGVPDRSQLDYQWSGTSAPPPSTRAPASPQASPKVYRRRGMAPAYADGSHFQGALTISGTSLRPRSPVAESGPPEPAHPSRSFTTARQV